MSGLLRICTAGSVDDGKSTLIGRLLYDSRGVYEDQISSVEKASKNRTAGPIDFSLFTDGLQRRAGAGHHDRRRVPLLRHRAAEVHPRGHARATSSTRATWRPAHRRRRSPSSWSTRATASASRPSGTARIARLLGITHFVLAVNKMDLMELRPERVRGDPRGLRQARSGAKPPTRSR